MANFVFPRSLLLVLVAVPVFSLDYFIYAPKVIKSQSNYSVSLLIENTPNPISVICSLRDGEKDVYKNTVKLVPDEIIKLTIPIELIRVNSKMWLTINSTDKVESFGHVTDLTVDWNPVRKTFVFIETDKPLYKAGETVKFRVITVDHLLLPKVVPAEIRIYDSALNTVQRYLNTTTKTEAKGFFSGEFQLSSDPLLGTWKISVVAQKEGLKENRTFTVDEYVLPRFNVTINPPRHISKRDDSFVIGVGARYTFDQDVTGDATLSFPKTSFSSMTIKNLTGIRDVTIKTSDIKEWSTLRNLTIFVTFKESLAKNASESRTAIVPISKDHFIVNVSPTSGTPYMPGVDFLVRITITDLDGKPYKPKSGGSNKVKLADYTESGDPSDQPIDLGVLGGDGSVEHVVKTSANTNIDVSFTVEFDGEKQVVAYPRLVSSSASFLIISPLPSDGRVGSTLEFKVRCSKHTEEPVQSIVTSSYTGQILYSAVDQLTGNDFTVKIPADEDMTQGARLLVTYRRSDGELVGNFLEFTVQRSTQNTVAVTADLPFGDTSLLPGTSAKVSVSTSPNAFVGVLATDESLLLVRPANVITDSLINGKLASGKLVIGHAAVTMTDYLQSTGLVLFTNLNITKPNSEEQRDAVVDEDDELIFEPNEVDDTRDVVDAVTTTTTPAPVAVKRVKAKTEVRMATPPKTRKDFRESFFFATGTADSSGQLSLRDDTPDSITSWRLSAFSLSPESGLAVTSEISRLTVFQPFFIVMDLPFSVTRTEELEIEVLIFSYLADEQVVAVSLWADEKAQYPVQLSQITVGGKQSNKAAFKMIAGPLGNFTFTARAVATPSNAADEIQKTMLVRPEGIEVEGNQQLFINLTDTDHLAQVQELKIADEHMKTMVNDSSSAQVQVIGDLLGSAANNFDGLLGLPMGCGEQNAALMAPNIIVGRYLNATGRFNGDDEERIRNNIRQGFERQLKFRHDDGSFSAWGPKNGKYNGSTWLTAYVARVFLQGQAFSDVITEDYISKALKWLAAKQKSNGDFPETGKIIDRRFQGGSGAGISLTAFTLLTYLESPKYRREYEKPIANGVAYLEKNLKVAEKDNYTLSIACYVLVLAKSKVAEKELAKLLSRVPSISSPMFWSNSPKFVSKEKDVETTSYVLLALLASGKMERTFAIVNWLTSEQNANGGFYSTPDTVIGLTALAEFARLTYVSNPSMTLNVDAGTKLKPFELNADNSMVLQQADLAELPKTFTVTATGKGSALANVKWKYYYIGNKTEGFKVAIEHQQFKKTNFSMNVCTNYLGTGENSSMAIMELKALTAYQFDSDDFEALQKSMSIIQKYEFKDRQSGATLYFDSISKKQICLQINQYKVQKVNNVQEKEIKVYDFYNTNKQAVVMYNLPPQTKA